MKRIALALLSLVVAVAFLAVPNSYSAESTLAKVKKRGVLVAGVKFDFPPMGFIDKKTGKPDGFDVDLVKEIAKKLGVKTKFVQALSKTRIPLIVNGNVDLIAATMTHKRSRDKVIDFSMHYLITGQRFITRKDTGIKHISQLAGKRVAAVQGGNAGPNLLKVQPKATVVPFQEHTENLLALKQKKVDAMVTDDILLQWMAKNNPDLVVPGKLYTIEPYGMGLRENDSDWRDFVNEVLLELWETKRYHAIWRKWFGRDPDFTLPWYPK
ncbi:MAG: transporter substrate-binding domain-containing protein [Nitrospinota bacterium]|jgi:polar amino acid transport system substrate-binding protein|nr:transporter substrate-binding domain-containing protein [Nitrospinota bacterium]